MSASSTRLLRPFRFASCSARRAQIMPCFPATCKDLNRSHRGCDAFSRAPTASHASSTISIQCRTGVRPAPSRWLWQPMFALTISSGRALSSASSLLSRRRRDSSGCPLGQGIGAGLDGTSASASVFSQRCAPPVVPKLPGCCAGARERQQGDSVTCRARGSGRLPRHFDHRSGQHHHQWAACAYYGGGIRTRRRCGRATGPARCPHCVQYAGGHAVH